MSEQQANHAHAGHRARLRARFLKEGLDAFEDHNALELLLFYALPQRDTNQLAHALMDRFGSLDAVFDAPLEQLTQVKGVGENTAALIKLMPALYRKYSQSKTAANALYLTSPEEAGVYCTSLFAGKSTEHCYAIFMNHKCKVLKTVLVSKGTAQNTQLDARALIEAGLYAGATHVIVTHNHPQGVAAPSAADVNETNRLSALLRAVQLQLDDHIIVAGEDYLSMAATPKFAPIFE